MRRTSWRRRTRCAGLPVTLAALGLLAACGKDGGSRGAPTIGTVSPAATRAGDRSKDILRASPYPRLHIEVIPVVNHEPDVPSLIVMLERLCAYARKPSGVTAAVLPAVPAEVQTGNTFSRWTNADLESFERRHRATQDGRDAMALQVLYVDGVYAGDPKATSVAYNDHAIAVFRDVMKPGASESRALVHELGHLLGLVNGATKMTRPHEDEKSPGHCSAAACAMARPTEEPGAEPSDDFDEACQADLVRIVEEPAPER